MKKYFTYIIYSSKINRYYIGHTRNINLRVERHNTGWGRYTKRGIPWELKYYEQYNTLAEAIKRELEIKRWKSRKKIEELIRSKERTTT
jgi:putative endonuclease